MREKYIEEFIPSEDMREYLKIPHQNVDTIAEIIYYSPAPVERKKIALTELLKELDSKTDEDMIFNTKAYLKTIEEAERLIEVEGVFSIEMVEYDENKGDSNYEFNGLFNNFNDLVQYVKKNMDECEITDEDFIYYQAVKWINDEAGKLVEACTYWIIRGQVWYVQLEGKVLDEGIPDIFMSHELNVAVPFKAGDIVEVDLYPFADKRIIGILEIGDNRDCCCLQGLSKRLDGSWTTGAIKHGHIGDILLLAVSALYTITTYKGELPSGYEILKDVSDFIDGSEERGSALWHKIYASKSDDGLADDELLSVIEKIREGA